MCVSCHTTVTCATHGVRDQEHTLMLSIRYHYVVSSDSRPVPPRTDSRVRVPGLRLLTNSSSGPTRCNTPGKSFYYYLLSFFSLRTKTTGPTLTLNRPPLRDVTPSQGAD